MIERPEHTRQRPSIPLWVKFALMLLVVFGLVVSGWLSRKERADVRLVAEPVIDFTSLYADVYFTVENRSAVVYTDLPVMIKLYADTEAGALQIGSLLTTIDVAARSNGRMLRRLEKLDRPIVEGEALFATVELHQHKGLF